MGLGPRRQKSQQNTSEVDTSSPNKEKNFPPIPTLRTRHETLRARKKMSQPQQSTKFKAGPGC